MEGESENQQGRVFTENSENEAMTDDEMGANGSNETDENTDDEDELVMEYEVYLTHKLEENLFMIQYPLRPKER